MFTHPALLRELTQAAQLLRRNGETAWARRLIQTADAIRRSGWTQAGRKSWLGLYEGEASLDSLELKGGGSACGELDLHRGRIKEMGSQPLARPALGPPQRSPDLE